MTILSKLGLMKRSEHEDRKLELDQAHQDLDDMTAERDALQFKFAKAVKDLAAQSEELAAFRAKRDRDNAGRRERRSRDRKAAKGGARG